MFRYTTKNSFASVPWQIGIHVPSILASIVLPHRGAKKDPLQFKQGVLWANNFLSREWVFRNSFKFLKMIAYIERSSKSREAHTNASKLKSK